MKFHKLILGIIVLALAFIFSPQIVFAAEEAFNLVTFCTVNAVVILGVLLAVSELLSLLPWFKGNGLLDAIIKGLKFLIANKKQRSEK